MTKELLMNPIAPQDIPPEDFDFPTPQEIVLAKKAGIVLDGDETGDFSQLAQLLDSVPCAK
jgi:hypothetical protein